MNVEGGTLAHMALYVKEPFMASTKEREILKPNPAPDWRRRMEWSPTVKRSRFSLSALLEYRAGILHIDKEVEMVCMFVYFRS